ncbi:MAG: polysaccharide biosynthesis/export family protein [Mesorhizobium sp.]
MPFRILCVCCLLALTAACTANSGTAPGEALSLQSASAGGGDLQLVTTLPPPANTHDGTEQPLSPNDVLEVDVFQADMLDRTVQIDSAGRISLPLIGTLNAAGKTVRQLESEIETAYGRSYLQNPDVTVFLKESAGQRVTVDGEVARAGLYPVSANTTLLDTIALAGGFRDIADQRKVYVFREVDGRKLVANYSVEAVRSGRLANPRIYGGDVVMVFTNEKRVALNNLKEALGIATSASRLAVGVP